MTPTAPGVPIVVSAASGTGKTSLCRRLLETLPSIEVSVSFTTRAPRGDEQDGREYHFTDRSTFEAMAAEGELVEWAEVFGNLYGTAERTIRAQIERGVDVLLDIDLQGGLQIRERFPEASLIFLLPPSMEELRRRLEGRGTDAPDVVERRLQDARAEIAQCRSYDYLVVNDDFDAAASTLRAIVIAARSRADRSHAVPAELLEAVEGAGRSD